MGDNRDHSLEQPLLGDSSISTPSWDRPFLIYWSVDANSADYGETTFAQRSVIGIFDTLVHLPARTRVEHACSTPCIETRIPVMASTLVWLV